MLNFKENTVKSYFLFVVLSIVFLLSGLFEAFLISKLFILPMLMILIFRYYQKSSHKLVPILLVSTFFSFLGDVLIVLEGEGFFKMISLSSFLVAQAGYAYMFYTSYRYNQNRPSVSWIRRWPEALSLLTITFCIIIVTPEMEAFLILGIIYGIIACISMILALDRRFYVSRKSYFTVFFGLVLFYISDVLAGLDLALSNTLIHTIIILSFASGHYLIISGIFQQVQDDTEKKEASNLDAFIN